MAVLDLQAMQTGASELAHDPHKSGSSGQSCPSTLSALICDGFSGLSVALCGHD